MRLLKNYNKRNIKVQQNYFSCKESAEDWMSFGQVPIASDT